MCSGTVEINSCLQVLLEQFKVLYNYRKNDFLDDKVTYLCYKSTNLSLKKLQK